MTKTLYDTDFAEWAARNAEYIRTEQTSKADWENIAEELDDMGKSRADALQSRIAQVCEHLLKLRLASGQLLEDNRRGWQGSIARQQVKIQKLLRESPSLRRLLATEEIQTSYRDAVKIVSAEYDFQPPAECPFTLQDILGD